MLHPDRILGFAAAQKALLVETYDQAWRLGVQNYTPSARPTDPQAERDRERDEALLTDTTLLAARALRTYRPPVRPDQTRRAVALAPAFHSIDRITGELSTLSPTLEHIQAANDAVAAGETDNAAEYAQAQALNDWLDSNAWRFNAADSVAWAGEQAGYGEAADSAGDLLNWQDTGLPNECDDCEVLATMGPMPLEQWPTTPGSGSTECSSGCRCALDSAGPGYGFQGFSLSDAQLVTAGKVVGVASDALSGLMPDMALLG